MHQPIFRRTKSVVTISCDCRAIYGKHSRVKGGGEVFEPMEVRPGEMLLEAYNRPENHYEEFTDENKVRL